MDKNESNFIFYIKNIISGGFGGICLVIAGHPLDTIKVLLQTMQKSENKNPFNGTFDCAKKIIKKEGFLALYKGMGPPILGIQPIYASTFLGYSFGKKIQQKNNKQLTIIQLFNAGFLAGGVASLITSPVERVKCLLQVQTTNLNKINKLNNLTKIKYKSTFDCVSQLYKKNKLKGIYRGFCITFIRDAPNTGIYFATYEYLLNMFTKSKKNLNNKKESLKPIETLIAGGLAGTAYWIFAIPFDKIKSRIQSVFEINKTYKNILKEIVVEEGFLGFYKKSLPVFLRAFPANAACFFGYEVTMKLLNYLFNN